MDSGTIIGANIKKARQAAGLTQRQLAAAIGKGFSTVQKYEMGIVEPTVEVLNKLAAPLNVSMGYFIGFGTSQDYEKTELDAPPTHHVLSLSAHRVGRAYERATPPVKRTVDVALEPYMDEQIIYVEFSQSEQRASAGTGVFLSEESMITLSVRLDALPDGYERHPENYFGVPVSGDSMEPKYHDGDILIVSKEPLNVGDIGIVIMDGEGYVKKIGSGTLCPLNPAYDDIPITESVSFCGKVVGTLDPEWVR